MTGCGGGRRACGSRRCRRRGEFEGAGGTFQDNCTSLPFGDGLTCTYLNNPQESPLHFTGKQRDFESGLDNFGARFNSSSFGRFTSPDPENAGVDDVDPQSWNAYAYVMNNPLNDVDPDGRTDCPDKDPYKCTVTAQAPPSEPRITYRFVVVWENAGRAAQRANDYLHTAWDFWINTRPNSGCVAASTAAGAIGGAVIGAKTGYGLGAAGGTIGGTVLEPGGGTAVGFFGGGALGGTAGGIAGAGVGTAGGYLVGQVVCRVGGNGGNGGNGSSNGGNTQHGAQRIGERGFTPEEIAETKTGTVMTQADGATVYIKGTGAGKYNIIVEGDNGIVTAMKGKTSAEVRALAERYGWHL